MKWKLLLVLFVGLLTVGFGSSALISETTGVPVTPLAIETKGGYLPDTGDVWIDSTGVIVSSFKWVNPQFGGYYPGTYYEHEFRVEADPNWDKISYGGQYITNLPDGYVDEDDLGVGGNAEKIQDGKWYYSYVWISGPSGVHHTNCYLEGEEGIYYPGAPSNGVPIRYWALVKNIEFYMGSDSQVYTWNENFEDPWTLTKTYNTVLKGHKNTKNRYSISLNNEATIEDVQQIINGLPDNSVVHVEVLINTNNPAIGTITVGFKTNRNLKDSYREMITKILTLQDSLRVNFMRDGYLDEREKSHLEFLEVTYKEMLKKIEGSKVSNIKFRIIVENIDLVKLQKLKETNTIIEEIGGQYR